MLSVCEREPDRAKREREMGVLGSGSTVHGIQMLGKCDVFLMA